MYCPNCGTQNNDSAAFCASCGKPLSGANQGTQNQGTQNQGTYTQNGYAPYQGTSNQGQNGYNGNTYDPNARQHNGQDFSQQAKAAFGQAQNAINGFFTLNKPWATQTDATLGKFLFSPFTLITVGLFTLNILIAVLTAGSAASDFLISIADWLYKYDMSDGAEVFEWLAREVSTTARVFALIFNTPNIVLAVGMWLTVWSAYDKKQNFISVNGPKVIKIMSIISAISSAVGLGITAIVLIIYLFIILFQVGFGAFLLSLILFAIILAAMAFSAFYNYKVYTTARDFEQTVLTKQVHTPSLLVEIMCYVTAGYQFVSTIIAFSVSALFGVATCVLFGILIHQLRTVMSGTTSANNGGGFYAYNGTDNNGNGFGSYNGNNGNNGGNDFYTYNGNNGNNGNGNNPTGF